MLTRLKSFSRFSFPAFELGYNSLFYFDPRTMSKITKIAPMDYETQHKFRDTVNEMLYLQNKMKYWEVGNHLESLIKNTNKVEIMQEKISQLGIIVPKGASGITGYSVDVCGHFGVNMLPNLFNIKEYHEVLQKYLLEDENLAKLFFQIFAFPSYSKTLDAKEMLQVYKNNLIDALIDTYSGSDNAVELLQKSLQEIEKSILVIAEGDYRQVSKRAFVKTSFYRHNLKDSTLFATLASTTPVHELDGDALWMQQHNKVTGDLSFYSLHIGTHNSVLVDTANVYSASPILLVAAHNFHQAMLRISALLDSKAKKSDLLKILNDVNEMTKLKQNLLHGHELEAVQTYLEWQSTHPLGGQAFSLERMISGGNTIAGFDSIIKL